MLTQAKREFIEFMMSADVLRFGNFVTKSGRNTPYFVNTGNYRTGKQLATLGKFYARLIHETLGDQFDAMFGPAYKGIPLAAVTASTLAQEGRGAENWVWGQVCWAVATEAAGTRLPAPLGPPQPKHPPRGI